MITQFTALIDQRMSKPQDLKTIGLKATAPRLKILSLFEKSKVRHLSAEDVYKLLVADGLDSGLATVYRVLTQFEHAGFLLGGAFLLGVGRAGNYVLGAS